MADHMEVAPRMWDKTIAATYTSKKKEDVDIEEEDNVVEVAAKSGGAAVVAAATTAASAAVQDMSFFTRFKTYLMPALFVLCFIVVLYILWKYFTKYKNENKQENKQETPVIQASELDEDPMAILASEDLHKYELDSDDEQSNSDTIKPQNQTHVSHDNKLYDIEEVTEEDDESEEEDDEEGEEESEEEESEEDGSEEEDDDSEGRESDAENSEDEPEEDEKPDLSKIEQYILEDTDDLPILEDDMFSITTYDSHVKMNSTPAPKKKSRKPKRITL